MDKYKNISAPDKQKVIGQGPPRLEAQRHNLNSDIETANCTCINYRNIKKGLDFICRLVCPSVELPNLYCG